MAPSPSNSIESYEDATRWIYERIDYERIRPRKSSTHFRLERVEKLLALIGSPQQRIPAIHIAGTKGKGSTSAMLASILRCSSLSTGLFTSPHIERFEERMRIDGAMPTPDELVDLVRRLAAVLEAADPEIIDAGVTYFEVATLLAWMFFDDHDVGIVVLETGLGGRLDCTTVCRPVLTLITNIGLDHTHILGDTLPLIAGEKAGIMKAGVPLLTWATQPEVLDVFAEHAARLQCTTWRGGQEITCDVPETGDTSAGVSFSVNTPWAEHAALTLPLQGRHQALNASLAVAAADYLQHESQQFAEVWPRLAAWCRLISPATVASGLASVQWPLRFQICPGRPTVILDAAHNPDSMAAFLATLQGYGSPQQTRVLIFASSSDKDIDTMLQQAVPQFDHVILTRFENNPRAVDADALQDLVRRQQLSCRGGGRLLTAESPAAALALARQQAGDEGIICGTGSIFVAAELLQELNSGAIR